MKDLNSDIKIKCPQSGVCFHPKRLNQLFRTPDDGWTYRNRLNRIKDPNIAHKMKANIANLKIILGFLPNLHEFHSAKYSELEGFDWDAAEMIVNPFNKQILDCKITYYHVHGFIVIKSLTRIRIYDLETSEIVLKWKHSNLE